MGIQNNQMGLKPFNHLYRFVSVVRHSADVDMGIRNQDIPDHLPSRFEVIYNEDFDHVVCSKMGLCW